jgi:hypothetical protein
VKWSNVGADGPRTLRGPNLRRKFQSAGYRFEEAAPVIGNPELGFAAPFTLSLDQPSRPVEIRIGDFGVATSAIGFRRAGHGRRNGFSVSDFDGGGGQKQIDRSLIESQSESFRSPHLRTLKMRETKRSRATWSLT